MILYIIMGATCLQGIDGSRARVVFIQIAKCADRRARTMEHAGSEYVFCLKCSHCCVYFSVLELLYTVTPGNPLTRPTVDDKQWIITWTWDAVNSFMSRQHGCHVADSIFIRNLLNGYIDTLIQISFVTSIKWSGLV